MILCGCIKAGAIHAMSDMFNDLLMPSMHSIISVVMLFCGTLESYGPIALVIVIVVGFL